MESAVESSQKEAEDFSEQVVKEVGIFESIKTEDFKGYLRDLADVEIEFHQKVSVLNKTDQTGTQILGVDDSSDE